MSQNENIDFVKFNHLLNSKKITINYLKRKCLSLSQKCRKQKNFKISNKEKKFIENNLATSILNITVKQKLPSFIYWSAKKINNTKRPINRDGIHFYNYYSLPTPKNYVGPVILDILCPKYKLPKLNNGHLEQAITVNIGKNDIYGRWGKKKNKYNFSKIKFNSSGKNSWIVGDTYVEPTYCPHSYSRANNLNSKILSYTAKSPVEKLVKNLNLWPKENFKNFIYSFDKKKINLSIFKIYLNQRGYTLSELNSKLKINAVSHESILNNQSKLNKVCRYISLDPSIFQKKFFNEDKIGKTYTSFKNSILSIRNFKSYKIASMASSARYPDLFGNFIKVFKKKKIKDILDYASSHYLVTGGKIFFYIKNKKIKLTSGDGLWVSSFEKHGFSGDGSLIKISNGETLDTNDISEVAKLFDPLYTLERSYQDNKTWGYE